VTVYERSFGIGALMAPSHPLAKRKTVSVKDCMEYPLAFAGGGSVCGPPWSGCWRAMRRKPPRLQSNSLRLTATLARRGRCIAFQTAVGIDAELQRKTLVLIPLSDREIPANRFVVMCETGRTANPALTAFAEFARTHLQELPA
jgi:DNA-binding transcriptional LysR family regulator